MIKSAVALAGALALTFLTQPVLGQSKEAMESCGGYADTAKMFMERRQSGESMRAMMEVADGLGGFEEVAKALVIKAYEEPRYHTEENKKRAAVDFSNDVYLSCITALKAKESQ